MSIKRFINCFYQYLKTDPRKWLFFVLICFIPSANHYFLADIKAKQPVIRSVDYQFKEPGNYPVNITKAPAPQLTAHSVIVVDIDSKAVILAKNPDIQLAPASTTKMITSLVALDNYDLDDQITLKKPRTIGQVMELQPGETISIKNLLYGLLVQSGNDAAFALADNFPGGYDEFINQMNQKARQLKLENTQFKNPAGLDEPGHYSTVRDLVFLARQLVNKPILSDIVSTIGLSLNGHELQNVNQLLGRIPGVVGVKTGWTAQAGECLISLVKRDNHQIIIGILKSQDRFGETEQLIDWVFDNHRWQKINLPPSG